MRRKVLFLYIKILFSARKRMLVYMLINTAAELCYGMSVVFIPSVLIGLLENTASVYEMSVCLAIFIISNFTKRIMALRLRAEREVQDQTLIMTVTDKMNRIPFYYLEHPEIKHKREGCIYAIQNYGAAYDLYTKGVEIISAITTSATILAVAIRLRATYIIILVLLSIIYIIVNGLLMNKKHSYSDKIIDLNYQYEYLQEVLIQKKYQVNNKIYHYSDYLLEGFKELNKKITNLFHAIRCLEANYESVLTILNNIQTGISYLFPIIKLINGDLIIGEFVLLINCGREISNKINSISSSLQKVSQSLDYMIPLYELMNIPDSESEEAHKDIGIIESIRMDSVSFKYPGSKDYILENINLEIRKNDKIALVGRNGAGKTTLIKLLLKLYKPTKGDIIVDNKSIYGEAGDVSNNTSVIFQDCKAFPLTIEENIVANKTDFEREELNGACITTTFNKILDEKKCGMDSLYNSEIYEDGIELSGGEKQLLAITRAYFRDGDLFIMDEPSSALDPIMKNKLLLQFDQITRGKTSILITHDYSLAQKCNRIIRLENGYLKEIKACEL